jgi:hypothetical protein
MARKAAALPVEIREESMPEKELGQAGSPRSTDSSVLPGVSLPSCPRCRARGRRPPGGCVRPDRRDHPAVGGRGPGRAQLLRRRLSSPTCSATHRLMTTTTSPRRTGTAQRHLAAPARQRLERQPSIPTETTVRQVLLRRREKVLPTVNARNSSTSVESRMTEAVDEKPVYEPRRATGSPTLQGLPLSATRTRERSSRGSAATGASRWSIGLAWLHDLRMSFATLATFST